MKKQINEASVKIDVQGLESSDLETLSRMLALAGQAETSAAPVAQPAPAISPLDIDSLGGDDEYEPLMSPADAPSADDLSDEGSDELGAAVDDLAGSVTDFGDEVVDNDDEFGVESDDMIGLPSPEEDEFDVGRMSSLAGIQESKVESDDEEVKESLLPDLTLDEDSVASDAHMTREFGPFRTEFECVNDGREKTNGIEGDNFIVVPKGNAFYWKRTIQESTDEAEYYDDEGIRNSRHEYKDKQPGTALGDNPLVGESDDEDESVDSILESINAQYKKYMEGL